MIDILKRAKANAYKKERHRRGHYMSIVTLSVKLIHGFSKKAQVFFFTENYLFMAFVALQHLKA